jgi:hypothetical protein
MRLAIKARLRCRVTELNRQLSSALECYKVWMLRGCDITSLVSIRRLAGFRICSGLEVAKLGHQ